MEDPNPPLRDLIAQVCERPQMYVASDGFRAACYFIMGYATGRGGEEREEEREFSRWLGLRLYKKSGLDTNCIWMAHLTAVYPDETHAYQELAKWYKKFLRSREPIDDLLAPPETEAASAFATGQPRRQKRDAERQG